MAKKHKRGHSRRRKLRGFGGKEYNPMDTVVATVAGGVTGYALEAADGAIPGTVTGGDSMVTPLIITVGVAAIEMFFGSNKTVKVATHGAEGALGYVLGQELKNKMVNGGGTPPSDNGTGAGTLPGRMGSINAIRKSYDTSKPNNF